MESKITICIVNRNMAETIGDAIQSVINQTFINWELIVADGGSTDNSVEVAKQFKDSRIKVVIDTDYVSQRLTNVFRGTTSPFLIYLASDDQLEPTFLEENLKVFKENPDIDVVYNSYNRHTFNDKMEKLGVREQRLSNPTESNLMDNYFMGVFWMFTRDIFEKAGGMTSSNPEAYDYAFALKCEYAGAKFYYLDKLLGWYRVWNKSDSVNMTPHKLWLTGENTRDRERERRKQCKS